MKKKKRKSPLKNRAIRTNDSKLPVVLSFLLPFAICCVAFTLGSLIVLKKGLYPFGNSMILAHDGWHQYYNFLVDFRNILLSGGSLQYTFKIGMGIGYSSLYAYYLASPLNFLCVLIPAAYMTEFYAFLTILKISLAGMFFGVYLRIVYRKNDKMIPIFALMYAFCSWAAGYYWNLIWLDAFALLPLLIAGTVCLLRDGKFRLYLISLALTLWCNYYIAYFCCIFVFLCFIGYNIVCWNGFRNFLRRFVRIGICTVIAVSLTAVLLIPTLKAMQITNSAKTREVSLLAMNIVEGTYGTTSEGQSILSLLKSETLPGFFDASRQVLSGLMTYPEITSMSGLPNVFCGFSAAILGIYYLLCKKIKLREKIFNLLLLFFLMTSFILRGLDYAWHGFHFPNQLPYRFSFLFSFVLIGMAYRAYHLIGDFKKWHLAIIVPLSALLIVNLVGAEMSGLLRFVLNAAVLLGMIGFFLLRGTTQKRRMLSNLLLVSVVICEMLVCLGSGIGKIGFTSRDDYPKAATGVQALLEYADTHSNDVFHRTEVSATQTLNDGALNNYYGASIFTSSANVNFTRFSRSLGFSSWPGSNRTSYYEGSPFTNTMCGIRYILDRDGKHLDPRFNTLAASSDGVNLLECSSYIAPGFMTDSALAEYVSEAAPFNPFDAQEAMFRSATGVDAPLYQLIPHQGTECEEGCSISFNAGTQFSYSLQETGTSDFGILYRAAESGLYCATVKADKGKEVKVYRNGELLMTRNIKAQSLFSLGELDAGDEIKLTVSVKDGKKGTITADVRLHNDAVYRQGLEQLADEPWVLTEFDDTHFVGTVEAKQDGLFYTSIPYEPGWTAEVDGKPVVLAETFDASKNDVKLTDAVISFPLSAGKHTVELDYTTPGLGLGAVVSAVGALALALLLRLRKKDFTLLPDIASEEVKSRKEWKALAGKDFDTLSDLTMPELERSNEPPEAPPPAEE